MKHRDHKQKGVVLLLLLLVFLVTGTAFMLGSLNSSQAMYVQQQTELNGQLQLAKESLMALAANSSTIYDNKRGPGFFPCPDTTNTGSADAACDATSVNLGRLPQYTTDTAGNKIFFNAYYANSGRQFWYAVAPGYVYSSDENVRKAVNRTSKQESDITSPRLTVDATNNIVAVILAPNESLNFQNREIGPLVAGNFLEGGNGDADRNFYMNNADPSAFNDQLIVITHDELMAYIGRNAAIEIKRLLDAFYETQPVPQQYPNDAIDPDTNYQAAFANVLASHYWLGDGGAYHELWAGNTKYALISPDKASLVFSGCPQMSFILDHDEGVTRDGNSC